MFSFLYFSSLKQTAFPTAYFLDKKHLMNRRLHTLIVSFFFFGQTVLHIATRNVHEVSRLVYLGIHIKISFLSMFQISYSWATYSPSLRLPHSLTKNKRNHSDHSGKSQHLRLGHTKEQRKCCSRNMLQLPKLIRSKISQYLDISTL